MSPPQLEKNKITLFSQKDKKGREISISRPRYFIKPFRGRRPHKNVMLSGCEAIQTTRQFLTVSFRPVACNGTERKRSNLDETVIPTRVIPNGAERRGA